MDITRITGAPEPPESRPVKDSKRRQSSDSESSSEAARVQSDDVKLSPEARRAVEVQKFARIAASIVDPARAGRMREAEQNIEQDRHNSPEAIDEISKRVLDDL